MARVDMYSTELSHEHELLHIRWSQCPTTALRLMHTLAEEDRLATHRRLYLFGRPRNRGRTDNVQIQTRRTLLPRASRPTYACDGIGDRG